MIIDNVTISINLNPGALACGGCGLAVDGPHKKVDVTTHVATKKSTRPAGVGGGHVGEVATPLTTCEHCRELRQQAEKVAPLLRLGGSRSIAVDRVMSALLVLDALGMRAPKITTRREAWLLVEHLNAAGAGVQWSARFTGTLAAGADPTTAAVERWSYLDSKQRQVLKDAAASYLRARIETPKHIAPPSGGGCAMCGVSSVYALPSKAHEVWQISGGNKYTCPQCTFVLGHMAVVGRAVGEASAEVALRAYLQIPRRAYDDRQFAGLTPWVQSGAKPNKTPWAHLDLGTVRKLFDSRF